MIFSVNTIIEGRSPNFAIIQLTTFEISFFVFKNQSNQIYIIDIYCRKFLKRTSKSFLFYFSNKRLKYSV